MLALLQDFPAPPVESTLSLHGHDRGGRILKKKIKNKT